MKSDNESLFKTNMHQSLIVRQRVDMYQESTSLVSIQKMISKKRKYQRKTKQRAKEIVGLVTVPRQVSEFFFIKASVELKLALSFFPDHCLGALKETPCTYNYRVTRTDLVDNVYFFTLELHDKANYDVKQIMKVLKHSQDPHAQLAIKCVKDRFKILQEYQKQKYISNEELHEIEKIAQSHPYQCTIQKVNKDSSVLSQRIVNEEFHKMMGISKEMMFHHLKQTNTLPSIFDLGQSLENWCLLSVGSISKSREFECEINTYEGMKYKCAIEQRQIFKRTQVNDAQIVFIEFWIFKLDDHLKNILMNPKRVYQNQIDYFNKKNTDEEYEKFQEIMNIKESPNYGNSHPCGYRQISWQQVC